MHHHYRPAAGVFILLALLLSWNNGAAADRAAERKRFLQAEQALQGGDQAGYRKLKRKLRDYPLYPYLELQELSRSIRQQKAAQIRRFLERHAGTPAAGILQRRWLDELGRRRDWAGYLAFYRPTRNSRRQCLYVQALLHQGKKQQALAAIPALWLKGRSQPKACDPVFTAWREAGGLTPERIWQRIELAIGAGQTRLVRYLKKQLPKAERPWVDRWLQVRRKPETILQAAEFSTTHPYRQKILLYGLKRLARQDPARAIAGWSRLQQQYPFDADQRYQARRSIGLQLIHHDQPQALSYLARLSPRPDDTRLHEGRIRHALKKRDWKQALEWIGQLPESLAETERWRYWQARSLQALGRQQEAQPLYRRLAGERSFYGFLAADRLELPYNLRHIPLSIPEQAVKRLAQRPAIQRAGEFFRLGRMVEARREWRHALKQMDNGELQAAAKLAQQWGWHPQAIFTLARTGYWDDLELRFPLLHRSRIESAAGERQLEDAWVFAVIRQESAFAADAHSSAGAIGLMQLMPGTARHTAKRIRQPAPRRRELTRPETNIRLGTAYLGYVLERLEQNPVLATSAYNAGPHRVKRWLPEQETAADLWVESIPFRETRRYTQRVFTYTVIYRHRLGKTPLRLQQLMPPIPAQPITTAGLAAERPGS